MPDVWGAQASSYGRWLAALDDYARGDEVDFAAMPPMTAPDHGVAVLLADRASAALRVRLDKWARDLSQGLDRARASVTQTEAAIVTGRRQLNRIRQLTESPLLFDALRQALSGSVTATVHTAQKQLIDMASKPGPNREQLLRIVRRTLLTSTADFGGADATPPDSRPAVGGRRLLSE